MIIDNRVIYYSLSVSFFPCNVTSKQFLTYILQSTGGGGGDDDDDCCGDNDDNDDNCAVVVDDDNCNYYEDADATDADDIAQPFILT